MPWYDEFEKIGYIDQVFPAVERHVRTGEHGLADVTARVDADLVVVRPADDVVVGFVGLTAIDVSLCAPTDVGSQSVFAFGAVCVGVVQIAVQLLPL